MFDATTLPCLSCGRPRVAAPACACGAPLVAPPPPAWEPALVSWLLQQTAERALTIYGGRPHGYPTLLTALYRGQQVVVPGTAGRLTIPQSATADDVFPLAWRLHAVSP